MNEISAQDFAYKVSEGKPKDEHWIDVRERWEWQIDHLEEAELIPMGELPLQLDQLHKEKQIYVICAHGVRSLHVQQFLLEQGFQQVVNVEGGLAKVRVYLGETSS